MTVSGQFLRQAVFTLHLLFLSFSVLFSILRIPDNNVIIRYIFFLCKCNVNSSTKLEVCVISSKGQGLWQQPEVKIATSFGLTTFQTLDGNQSPKRQDKQLCLFYIVKTLYCVKRLKLWFSVSQCYVEYNPFMISNYIRVQGKIVDKCLHGTIPFYTKQKHIKIHIWHYCISHAYYISRFILAQF